MALLLKKSLIVLCTLALTACGGGDSNYIVPPSGTGAGTGTGTGTTSSKVNTLDVKASSLELGSSGATPVIISAIAKDVNNNPLKDVTVQFAVDSNATIEPDATTASSGVKTAKLTPGDATNKTLQVTVKAETKTSTVNVAVAGTKLQIEGPSQLMANVATPYKIKLLDSDGKRIGGQQISVSSSAKNLITSVSGSNFLTNAQGEVDIELTAAVGGKDTILVSALGASTQQEVTISGEEFTLSSTNSEINVDTDESINLAWKNNGVAQANRVIKLTATRGTIPSQVTTNEKGEASFKIRSSTAGGTFIKATDEQTGLAASLSREFVAVAPKYLTIQATKQIIGPKENVEITALVRDANNNLVKNQVVLFTVSDAIGGGLSSGSAMTDSLGQASVIYTAGNTSSSKDGVVINAALEKNTNIAHQINLTVGARALRVVLGEDENMSESDVNYTKKFGVIVTDSAGNGVKGQEVLFSIHPIEYYKGAYAPCPTSDQKYWAQAITVSCANEDINFNGALEAGEDFNNNKRLDPSFASTVTSAAITDASGFASAVVTFPQSQAGWSKVKLVASVKNNGTEFQEFTEFTLPVSAGDIACSVPTPPNRVSPYGINPSCSDPN
ncbi:Ig-like domain-containing protein [Thiolinea disciformis]|uniref:Ig-like domain-containing protein n=1 Tax=Thiolinea disciformis TaxID=125614 RepID=UPI000377D8BA|nr:Ig-like domain-containing protein [Thiolinea disciformis]